MADTNTYRLSVDFMDDQIPNPRPHSGAVTDIWVWKGDVVPANRFRFCRFLIRNCREAGFSPTPSDLTHLWTFITEALTDPNSEGKLITLRITCEMPRSLKWFWYVWDE